MPDLKFGCIGIQLGPIAMRSFDGSSAEIRPGFVITKSVPFSIDEHWKKWLGTLRIDELQRSDCFLLSTVETQRPDLLDDETRLVVRRVQRLVQAFMLVTIPQYEGGEAIVAGAKGADASTVRRVDWLPRYVHLDSPGEWIFSKDRVAQLGSLVEALIAIDEREPQGDFGLIKRAFRAWEDAVRHHHPVERIHGVVRVVDGLLDAGTAQRFADRVEGTDLAPTLTRDDLIAIYGLRSKACHLDQWQDAIRDVGVDREDRAMELLRASELLASELLRRILTRPVLLEEYREERAARRFPKLAESDPSAFKSRFS